MEFMGRSSNARTVAVTINLLVVLIFSLVLVTSSARAPMVPPFPISARLVCDTVYGFQSGDTCFDLAKASNLTDKGFLDINPNLNCDDIFVGQWICTSGKLAA